MTFRAIAGLFLLNAAFVIAGLSLLFAMRGLRSLREVVRFSGVGYLIGAAAFGVLWTELLVVDIPMRGFGIVASLASLTFTGLVIGRWRDMAVPGLVGSRAVRRAALVTAAGLASVGLVLEALFRAARLQSLQTYDAWAFWVPKAKAIYLFGGLDEEVFTTAPGPSYPPLLPILHAASFHAMGGPDTVTLHLQHWFVVVGGVAAVAGCLWRHVPGWLLWPSLLLVLVVPRFGERLLEPQADVLLDVLFVVAALLIALWARDGGMWRLPAATVLLAAGALTKREGLVFAACVLLSAVVVAWARGRWAWLYLAACGAVIAAALLPWRIWFSSRGIATDTPSTGWGGVDRMWRSLELSADVLYSNERWSVVPVVASIALAAGMIWGDRRIAVFLGSVLALVFVGGAWVTYGYAEIPLTATESLNPVVRYTGAIILLAACSTPLLLAAVWRDAEASP